MSNRVDIVCKTCNKYIGLHEWNREFDRVRAVVALAPELAKLAKACESVARAMSIEGATPFTDGGPFFSPYWPERYQVALQFFATHEGHEIVAVDEWDHELPPVTVLHPVSQPPDTVPATAEGRKKSSRRMAAQTVPICMCPDECEVHRKSSL